MTPEQTERLLKSAQAYSAAQQRLLSAAIKLLQILQRSPDGNATDALLKLLKPLYADYAAIARRTRKA